MSKTSAVVAFFQDGLSAKTNLDDHLEARIPVP